MAKTHVDRLIEYLQEHKGKAALARIEADLGWPADKVGRLVAQSGGRLKRANTGPRAGVAQVAVELGARGCVPLYAEVGRVLATTWCRKQRWQAAIALDTALRGRAQTGVWSRPDCVVAHYPVRRKSLDEKATLSTFEIEPAGKFDIRSVYEAHAQGLGADFSWALFVRAASDAREAPHDDWARIQWAAGVCGVGLISVSNPGNVDTWVLECRAARRPDADRAAFVKRAIPPEARALTEMTLDQMRARTRSSK